MNVIVITTVSLGAIAFLSGVVLFLASKKFAVQENPLIDDVEALLPGANCGGCGFAGCRAFAEGLVDSNDLSRTCPVAGANVMQQIAKVLGVEMIQTDRMVARVNCRGGADSRREATYLGIRNCSAATIGNSVDLVCPYGCMGLGDCIRACKFDAIKLINGLAVVDEDKCVACGACVKTCPRNLISMTPYAKRVYVACSSPEKGADVKSYCSVGCIGCKLCEKACSYSAIEYQPFLSRVNPQNCTECMACVEKCPTKTILFRDGSMAIKETSTKENVLTA